MRSAGFGETPDELLHSLATKLEGGREWMEGQLASATSAAWTAFEVVATDTWVGMLNSHPMTFIPGVKSAEGTGEGPGGMSGKQVHLESLAKYRLDLSRHLGTILKPKVDLTGLSNVRAAYEAAFGKGRRADDLFADEELHRLEASRHVIVHRAGVVGTEFINRTKRTDINAREGQPLPLDGQMVSRLVNAGIRAGCKLLEFVEDKLSTGSCRPAPDAKPSCPTTWRRCPSHPGGGGGVPGSTRDPGGAIFSSPRGRGAGRSG
jgi:hypothetical protein